MNSLLEQSTALQTEAEALLQDSGLLEVLQTYGSIYETGSFKYGVMLDCDIDLHVINTHFDKALARRLLDELIEQGWWNCYNFHNWVDFRRDHFPVGYYLGLKADYGGHRWKIDTWLLSKVEEDNQEIDELFNGRISPDQRRAILELKLASHKQLIEATSVEIYHAVLRNHVMNVDDFREFTSAHSSFNASR